MWKDILLKNLRGDAFQNCHTIDKADRHYKFQIFEVLITETLSVIDPATKWKSIPVTGDDGVDFIGERKEIKTPYLLERPAEIVLGQVKRRSGGYDQAAFHYDIIRMIEYYNEKYAPHKTLFQIVHILSTDRKTDTKQWLQNASYPYVQYHISPINALDFFRFWRIESEFFLYLLEGVCTKEETDILLEYINSFNENWTDLIHAQVHTKRSSYLGELFTCELQIESQVDLTLGVYVTWEPACSDFESPIVLVFPYNMLKESHNGFYIPVYRMSKLFIKLKVLVAGEHNLGTLHLRSKSGQKICSLPLGNITVYPGIISSFFEAPFSPLLSELRNQIAQRASGLSLWSVTGQGGIGKTTLIRELMITAMNQGYYAVSVCCRNDIADSRQPILDLVAQLIPRKGDEPYVYEKLFELLRDYMGINFNYSWAEPVMDYILGKLNISQTPLVECLITLLLLACTQSPLFLWISDMHWASKEVISLFQALIVTMRRNELYFPNNLIFIFEGRDSETLLSEHKSIYPYEWMQFLQQRELRRFVLQPWQAYISKEFISMMVDPHNRQAAENERIIQLKELVFRYASGNPMHIKEYLRYLIDQQAVQLYPDGTMELVNYHAATLAENQSLRQIILARILFYREKYPDIIDCYIVLARINVNRLALYHYMETHVFIQYADYGALESEISILKQENGGISFLHEYYEEQFKLQTISNPNLLESLIDFLESNLMDSQDELECFDAVILRTLHPTPDQGLLADKLCSLLAKPVSDSIAFRCYEHLLRLPRRLFQESYSLSQLYFEMSEVAIRISSWKNAHQYLERILSLTPKTESDWLYRILAYKSLANICGVSLELDRSASLCKQGLEVAERMRVHSELNLREEFLRQYEMLLNRLAVTYWFMGRCDLSAPYQEKALALACARSDTYSIAHTLYETGIRKLHTDLLDGTRDIQRALELLPPRSQYTEPQERALVEVELLIAHLLTYAEQRRSNDLKNILERSQTLCQTLEVETANYESALCHIILGICYIEKGYPQEAIRCFYTSLDLAQIGALDTVLWKAYLNLAQAYACLDNGLGTHLEQIEHYAQLSKQLLDSGIKRNSTLSSYRDLLYLPLLQIERLLKRPVCLNRPQGVQEPLSVESRGYRFFIMD